MVRDIVGHLIDVTEGYLPTFDASVSGAEMPAPLELPPMAERLDEAAQSHRSLAQAEAHDRLRDDFAKLNASFSLARWGNDDPCRLLRGLRGCI